MQSATFESVVANLELSSKAPILLGNAVGNWQVADGGPQCFFVKSETPGWVIPPHFHHSDQFQVVVSGSGTFGKHAIAPFVVHYADSDSPYGPIISGEAGLGFFTIRARSDTGSHRMPGSRAEMRRKAGRNISAEVSPNPPGLESLIAFDDGVAAMNVPVAPGERFVEPGDRFDLPRYWLVTSGSLMVGEESYGPRSITYVGPGETPEDIQAGAEGATVLLMRFRQPIDAITP